MSAGLGSALRRIAREADAVSDAAAQKIDPAQLGPAVSLAFALRGESPARSGSPLPFHPVQARRMVVRPPSLAVTEIVRMLIGRIGTWS
jgi:hypothetical protein